ncbi:hypothetical protein CMV_013152 [Castanea mollissima]|uniref:RING-type E3 ubiquitin transferase n=1 Tax=Castanea mollissima TaxID=60419 RepID=A0A8J4RFF2_9ROSI|nr:hypothetical protein CMV_013152 [Castanea mollissima]
MLPPSFRLICRGVMAMGFRLVCDGTIFPSLLKDMSSVVLVGSFNEQAQKLLELHLASGFQKYFLWLRGNRQSDHTALIQKGKDLVSYALINAIAIRKILKKYDKIHDSKQGQTFKSQTQSMRIEILQSPWLCELMAFLINSRDSKVKSEKAPAFESCNLIFNDGKPSLTCEIFESIIKLDIDLTVLYACRIYGEEKAHLSRCSSETTNQFILFYFQKETVFDPVSLTCGHIFCYMCACSAASVTIIDGLKAVEAKGKCPLCREVGVFDGVVRLDELNILLSQSCHEYWEQRHQRERVERIQQAKQYWENQCLALSARNQATSAS